MIDGIRTVIEQLRKEKPHFPYGCCKPAAERLSITHGFVFVEGFFRQSGVMIHHCWNYDAEHDRIIDTTVQQFAFQYPEVFMIDAKSALARKLYIPF